MHSVQRFIAPAATLSQTKHATTATANGTKTPPETLAAAVQQQLSSTVVPEQHTCFNADINDLQWQAVTDIVGRSHTAVNAVPYIVFGPPGKFVSCCIRTAMTPCMS